MSTIGCLLTPMNHGPFILLSSCTLMPLARVFTVSNVDHAEKEKCSPKKIKKKP
jgi:hypothetical protein